MEPEGMTKASTTKARKTKARMKATRMDSMVSLMFSFSGGGVVAAGAGGGGGGEMAGGMVRGLYRCGCVGPAEGFCCGSTIIGVPRVRWGEPHATVGIRRGIFSSLVE